MPTHAEWLQELFERQDFLAANVQPCPKCDGKQVQLMDKGTPAAWRCRVCKFNWRQEPRQF